MPITISNLLKRVKYHFSSDKRVLDDYMTRIRNLETLTDSDWTRFKQLAENEKNIKTTPHY